jgi:transmembrane sensor
MNAELNKKPGDDGTFRDMDTGRKIARIASGLKVPARVSKEEALKQVKNRIAYDLKSTPSSESVSRTIRPIYWIGAAAASLILLFATWSIFIFQPKTEVVAKMAQHIEYQLPDGSSVSLNADSKIGFRKKEFNENRELTLEGQAYFDVRKGNAFRIHTKNANITVLGTSFDVFARDNYFKVSCLTGKIRVACGDQSVLINPGESAVLKDNKLSGFMDKNCSVAADWRKGEIFFENAPLNMIFSELERQFNIKFVMPDLKERLFTGSFTNKNLVNALDIVCIPMDLNYEIGANGRILIQERSK